MTKNDKNDRNDRKDWKDWNDRKAPQCQQLKYQFESLACKWNNLFLTVQGVKLEKNHLYGY